jgi:hypothetical protein
MRCRLSLAIVLALSVGVSCTSPSPSPDDSGIASRTKASSRSPRLTWDQLSHLDLVVRAQRSDNRQLLLIGDSSTCQLHRRLPERLQSFYAGTCPILPALPRVFVHVYGMSADLQLARGSGELHILVTQIKAPEGPSRTVIKVTREGPCEADQVSGNAFSCDVPQLWEVSQPVRNSRFIVSDSLSWAKLTAMVRGHLLQVRWRSMTGPHVEVGPLQGWVLNESAGMVAAGHWGSVVWKSTNKPKSLLFRRADVRSLARNDLRSLRSHR